MDIKNRVKGQKNISLQDFYAMEFNDLKDEKDRDVSKLVVSIKQDGFIAPVYVWKDHNYVIDGKGREMAMHLLEDEGHTMKTVPIIEIEADNLQDAKALALKYSSRYGKISKSSFEAFTEDFDVDWNGIDLEGIDQFSLEKKNEKDDEAPETPDEATSKLGQIYQMGPHRLMCGSATDPDQMAQLMGNVKADMVFTDPPYNVDYKGKGENTKEGILNDKMSDENFQVFMNETYDMMERHSKKSSPWYVCHNHKAQVEFEIGIETTGRSCKTQIIWVKPSAGLGMNEYRSQHEVMFYAVHRDEKVKFYGDRTNTTVWDLSMSPEDMLKEFKKLKAGTSSVWRIGRDNVLDYAHPTQKPVDLVGRAILNSSKAEDVILDSFLGSGTTLIAAQKHGRVCYGMELDPKYVDVIVQRWEEYTGEEAKLLTA